jgi:hypothetical protein
MASPERGIFFRGFLLSTPPIVCSATHKYNICLFLLFPSYFYLILLNILKRYSQKFLDINTIIKYSNG